MRSVSVVGVADPILPASWSGTSHAICREIYKKGRLDSTFKSSSDSKIFLGLAEITSKIRYNESTEYERGKYYRYLSARKIYKRYKSDNAVPILHMNQLGLPKLKIDRNDHYVFLDASWHVWIQGRKEHSYSQKLIVDSERMEKLAYSQVNHIFSTSQFVKEDLIKHYCVEPEKISVVGTGLGKINPYNGNKDYSDKTILFVAKERYEDKGGPLLIDGFIKAQKEMSDLKLIIIGDEKYRSMIPNNPNIVVTGYISQEKLQFLFESASLFAMPAKNEPWGLVYLEALSCKTPVLGLRRNALPEITENGRHGFLIDEESPDAIADALVEAFSSTNTLERMGKSGQQYCLENFSWEKTASKILEKIH